MRRVSSSLIAGALGPSMDRSDPLHQQLYESLREHILLGRFSPGQQVPSTRILAADLGVSRNTILHAFEQLRTEGYLEGETGSGTYVARALPEQMVRASRSAPLQHPARASVRRWSRFGSRIASNSGMASRPVAYRPFQPGMPALDVFPFEIWTKLANRYRKSGSRELLAYGAAGGYQPLRKAIATYLTLARGVRCDPEQVIVVSGAQQAMDLTARLLLDPGDSVWMEEPGYNGAHIAFEAASAKLIPVPVADDGLDVARGVARDAKARLVYTTPSHQYPLGATMSVARRIELLNWAAQSGAWILEDDYDSEFRYASRPLPALQSLDQNGSVIYLGTFSKVLFPALRLGYLVAPPDLVNGFLAAKKIADYHCPVLDQAVTAEFMMEGHFSRHIRRMRTLYLERLEIFLEAIRTETDGALAIERPDAGMHVVARLTPGVDDIAVANAAARLGVSCTPLSCCYAGPRRVAGLLLGYAGYGSRQVRLGLRKLSAVLNSQANSHYG